MPFKLSLIALVYPDPANESGLNVDLLQKANAWLQRRHLGALDDLLLIGLGVGDETTFRAQLKPYGLADAEVQVIPPDEFDLTGSGDLGECVEPIAMSWISKHHGGAIPVVSWKELVPDAAYQADGWWWTGIEAKDDKQSTLDRILSKLLPDVFKRQALTWATIIADTDNLDADGEAHQAYEAEMQTVALVRWLCGFEAAADYNFYDFSASQAVVASGLDTLRLGFDAGRSYESELTEYFNGEELDEGESAGACLKACLKGRMDSIRSSLSTAFDGESCLFWSLYRSIWPDLKCSSSDNMERLLGLADVEMGDIDRPWNFVNDGWIDFEDED